MGKKRGCTIVKEKHLRSPQITITWGDVSLREKRANCCPPKCLKEENGLVLKREWFI